VDDRDYSGERIPIQEEWSDTRLSAQCGQIYPDWYHNPFQESRSVMGIHQPIQERRTETRDPKLCK